jgi:hypothetical protein
LFKPLCFAFPLCAVYNKAAAKGTGSGCCHCTDAGLAGSFSHGGSNLWKVHGS